MIDTAALRRAASDIGTLQAEIGVTTRRIDGEWRRDLVALRRRLQRAISAASESIGMFRQDDVGDRELRNAFERMRNKVALHQASWPAVNIDRDDPSYGASLRELRLSSRNFLRLVDERPQGTNTSS